MQGMLQSYCEWEVLRSGMASCCANEMFCLCCHNRRKSQLYRINKRYCATQSTFEKAKS